MNNFDTTVKAGGNRKRRICITLYGSANHEGSEVSGLMIWQSQLVNAYREKGFEVLELYFSVGKEAGSRDGNRIVFHVDPSARRFGMRRELEKYGIRSGAAALTLEAEMLRLFHVLDLDAFFIVNWISTGMALWDVATKLEVPVFFLPTEHSAVCHLGFLLTPSGLACVGPEGGLKCSDCTNGVQVKQAVFRYRDWYSHKFYFIELAASWLPPKFRRSTVKFLSRLIVNQDSRLKPNVGRARFESARRFLSFSKIYVVFQSKSQRKLFERSIGQQIQQFAPDVIIENRKLTYMANLDRRKIGLRTSPKIFLFAARSGYDRGLNFLLDAWEAWKPKGSAASLILCTDMLRMSVRFRINQLQRNGCQIELREGRLNELEYLEIHRQVHFVVNPALWEEPLSGTVIEGFSLGTPAIVPSKTGSSDFLESANGFVFEFRDILSLVQRLNEASCIGEDWISLPKGALEMSQKYRLLVRDKIDQIDKLIVDDS